MATVATVFTRVPWIRTPQQVLECLFPTDRQTRGDKAVAPRPENKRVWASLVKGKSTVIAFISKNWRGQPLFSLEVIESLIAATTTPKGLKVQEEIDRGRYPSGAKVSKTEMAEIDLRRDDFHGDWNYELHPVIVQGK